MVSYFGEVVFPTSRAFWDGDDEEDLINLQNALEISVRWLADKPDRIKKLMIIDGDMIIAFSKGCLCPDSEEICVVEDQNHKKLSIFYKVNDDVYLCLISPQFDVKYAGEFVIKISDILLSAEAIVSIACYHVSQFKSSNVPTEPSFLRVLSTKNGEELCKLDTKLLEQPNIVYGFAAGVLSYAQFMEVPSALYILYVDSFALDSKSAEPLRKLFIEQINCTLHDVSFTGKNFFSKGNLYM